MKQMFRVCPTRGIEKVTVDRETECFVSVNGVPLLKAPDGGPCYFDSRAVAERWLFDHFDGMIAEHLAQIEALRKQRKALMAFRAPQAVGK
jgi:hypothetical protein